MFENKIKFVYNDIMYDVVYAFNAHCDYYGQCDVFIDIARHKALLVRRNQKDVVSIIDVKSSTMGVLLFPCFNQKDVCEYEKESFFVCVDFINEIEKRTEMRVYLH